jgi:hypothetical protein
MAAASRQAAAISPSSFLPEPNNLAAMDPSKTPGEHQGAPIFVDLDYDYESESDCSYDAGGVNCDWEDSAKIPL